MRFLRYLFLGAIAIVLVVVSLANREVVRLKLLPEELATLTAWNPDIDLPIFLILFIGIVIGLFIGFVWEYLREHKHRAAASHHRRERERLEKEVDRLKEPERGSADEVLAIIDKREPAR